jgi:hypothetical protein
MSDASQVEFYDRERAAVEAAMTPEEKLEAKLKADADEARQALHEELTNHKRAREAELELKLETDAKKARMELETARLKREAAAQKVQMELAAKAQLDRMNAEALARQELQRTTKNTLLGFLLMLRTLLFMSSHDVDVIESPVHTEMGYKTTRCNIPNTASRVGSYGFKLLVQNGQNIVSMVMSETSRNNVLGRFSEYTCLVDICKSMIISAESGAWTVNLSTLLDLMPTPLNTIDVPKICETITKFIQAVSTKPVGSILAIASGEKDGKKYIQLSSTVEGEYPIILVEHIDTICKFVRDKYVPRQ